MQTKLLAGCLFYDKSGKILLQGRKGISSTGEEWSFFGGHIEEGESVEEGIKREIKEELNYDLEEFRFLGKIERIVGEVLQKEHVFVAQLPTKKLELLEGSEMKLFSIDEALNLQMFASSSAVLHMMKVELKDRGILE